MFQQDRQHRRREIAQSAQGSGVALSRHRVLTESCVLNFLNNQVNFSYCQGTGMIAASLLLLLEEEDAFWMMCTIVEDLLPASYYSSTLLGRCKAFCCVVFFYIFAFLGVQADQRVLRNLVTNFLPNIDQVLREHDIELALISANWFLTLFASVVHMKVLMRVWDLFFFEGSITLFQVTLGMLKNRGG
jgi:small G protein signaling modulator 3